VKDPEAVRLKLSRARVEVKSSSTTSAYRRPSTTTRGTWSGC
jgi:hypothetical protein